MEKISITTPTIKLNNLLKYAALVSSGGEAKMLIQDGEVKVNGEVCTVVRKQIVPGDTVTIGDETIEVVAE